MRAYPRDLTEYLRERLGKLPRGTRVALAWDPRGRVTAGDALPDSAGQLWDVYAFDGDDAAFVSRWRERDRERRALVLLRLRRQLKLRPLDLSYQERLLTEAEAFVDLRLSAILADLTGVHWNDDAVRLVEDIFVRDLSGALTALATLQLAGPVGVTELRAVALATLAPGLRPRDLLEPPPGDP
ncbi:MAG: hypothetical protein HY329_22625, partial [Chloroflexi bacterium]|nr:hypothetical protein [Chloroflexota bacterium]